MSLPPPNKNGPNLKTSTPNEVATSISSKFITSDPATFAKKLSALGNNNEVLIVLKSESALGISRSTLEKLPANGTIALPKPSNSTPRRTTFGFAHVDGQSREAVKNILKTKKAIKYKAPDFGNVITAKLIEASSEKVIRALLNNPNVDYIEANQSYPVHFNSDPAIYKLNFRPPAFSPIFTGNPNGSNPSDLKHTFHNVLDAWDYTRGSGAKVGILDSGFSYDQGTSSYHPDGQLISSTKGIQKLGFVDDFDNYGNCNGGSGQPYGNCLPWDDNYSLGHGTNMAGLVGANDNSLGSVGIMPNGLTVSMKIVQNCHITQGCANNNDNYNIENDDFYWAIEYARNNDIDVLSMSFTGKGYISYTVYNTLYDAYYNDDILLLSSSGNDNDPSGWDEPEKYEFVMGVGGLNSDESNYGEENYEEVSALSGGKTFNVFCASQTTFCKPNGSHFLYTPSGGTSSSTAITAAIAGLVRAHEPSLTAPQLRQRLIDTSTGYGHKVNALGAVTNNIPLTVSISGPGYIFSSGSYTWQAVAANGDAGYNYLWKYRESLSDPWQTVSTNQQYTRFVSTNGQRFFLQLNVTSGSEQATSFKTINVSSEDCPPNQICA